MTAASIAAVQDARPSGNRLRQRRQATLSPTGSGKPMSRKELAAAVNAYVRATTGRASGLRATEIGRYERGEVHWPNKAYRQALRTILQAESDEELGFYPTRRGPTVREAAAQTAEQMTGGQVTAHVLVRRDGQILAVRGQGASWFQLPDERVEAAQPVLSGLTHQVVRQAGAAVTVIVLADGVEHTPLAGTHRLLTLVFEAAEVAAEASQRPRALTRRN